MGEIKVGYHTITWEEDFERAFDDFARRLLIDKGQITPLNVS